MKLDTFNQVFVWCMDLPNLFNVKSAQAARRVVALVIGDGTIQSLLLRLHAGTSQTARQSELLPYDDERSLLLASDEALQQLGKESEDVNEALFCLQASWFAAENTLLAEKQQLLAGLTKELLLRPIGYVLQTETVTDYFLAENSQLTATIVYIDDQAWSAQTVWSGQASNVISITLTDDTPADLSRLFARLLHQGLANAIPGRVILASASSPQSLLIQLQQEIMEFSPSGKVTFAQQKQVEIVAANHTLQMIGVGAGKAIRRMSDAAHDQQPEVVAATAVVGASTLTPVDQASENASPEIATGSIVEGNLVGESDSELESAVAAEPILSNSDEAIDDSGTETESNVVPVATTATSFGIPFAVATSPVALKSVSSALPSAGVSTPIGPDRASSRHSRLKWRHPRNLLLALSSGLFAGLLVLGVLGWVYLTQFLQVTVTVVPQSTQVADKVELTLDPTLKQSDPQARKLRAELVTEKAETSGTAKATGIKIVGDKAKGDVLLLNKTNASKFFQTGTILTFNGKQYLLETAVDVPAASTSAKPGGLGEEKDYGRGTVKVAANKIGVEMNLPKNTQFTVASFDQSSYTAQAQTELTGGSSREVRVVAKEDQDALVAQLKKELQKEVLAKLKANTAQDKRVILNPNVAVTKAIFSAKEGAEVEDVSVELGVEAKGLTYQVADLQPIAQAVLLNKTPAGYVLVGEPQILSVENVAGGKEYVVTADVSSQAVAQLAADQITQAVAGETVQSATEKIQQLPGVAQVSVMFIPSWLTAVMSKLPSDPARIAVVLSKP